MLTLLNKKSTASIVFKKVYLEKEKLGHGFRVYLLFHAEKGQQIDSS